VIQHRKRLFIILVLEPAALPGGGKDNGELRHRLSLICGLTGHCVDSIATGQFDKWCELLVRVQTWRYGQQGIRISSGFRPEIDLKPPSEIVSPSRVTVRK